jgi:hypothetical protein
MQLGLGLDDALLGLASRLLDILAGEGRQHQLQNLLVEAAAIILVVVNAGGFKQAGSSRSA